MKAQELLGCSSYHQPFLVLMGKVGRERWH